MMMKAHGMAVHITSHLCEEVWPSEVLHITGSSFNIKTIFLGIGISKITIRQWWDCLFHSGNSYSGEIMRWHLYILRWPPVRHIFDLFFVFVCTIAFSRIHSRLTRVLHQGHPPVKSNLFCPSDKFSWQPGCPVLNINIQGNFCISQGNGSSDNLPENLV